MALRNWLGASVLVLAACASDGDSIRDGARAACVAQEVAEEELEDCTDRMAATIRAARAEARDNGAPAPEPP